MAITRTFGFYRALVLGVALVWAFLAVVGLTEYGLPEYSGWDGRCSTNDRLYIIIFAGFGLVGSSAAAFLALSRRTTGYLIAVPAVCLAADVVLLFFWPEGRSVDPALCGY